MKPLIPRHHNATWRPRVSILALASLLALLQSAPAPAAAPVVPPTAPVILETARLRFALSPIDGTYALDDKRAGVTWRSSPFAARFGEASVMAGGQSQRWELKACTVRPSGRELEVTFHPDPANTERWLQITIATADHGSALDFRYLAAPGVTVDSIRLLEDALWATDTEGGVVLAPVREGLRVPANSGLNFQHRFDTYAYEGCHMAMLGVLKGGAAALLTWTDPYVAAEVRSVVTNLTGVAGGQVLAPSLVLRKSARSFRLALLGRGDHNTVAQAYRQVARDRGWFVPWQQKLRGHPERAKLFGASNYKLWSVLSRQMNEESSREESVRLNWTFEEAAQVAEHLKQDLEMDRVLFTLGGWIHRGYDNQHPDILPSAPECGGDAAFADCSRRVQQLGYLFCLHDNYQDIYRDSPSWDEKWIMKNADGSLTKGGHWAGGRAYLTCSQQALELARRPQNLPAVRSLTRANSYFIDTTYAAGLCECFDPAHPLTRADDLKWKQAISDYAREVFGVFGSECGREWAIPHSDFFEGLTGVSGGYYHDKNLLAKIGGTVVPLFELVYRDTIAMYGKYGYDPKRAAEYVLHHLLIGRPLHYHNVPAHLYWKASKPESSTDLATNTAVFVRGDGGWTDGFHPFDRFVKNTHEILSPLNEITATLPMTRHEFVTRDPTVQRTVFGTGENAVTVVVNRGPGNWTVPSELGGEVRLPAYGFLVESPEFVAFHATRWGGRNHDVSTLFTLRSLDGRSLAKSRRVRIYHGFGPGELVLQGQTLNVGRGTTWTGLPR